MRASTPAVPIRNPVGPDVDLPGICASRIRAAPLHVSIPFPVKWAREIAWLPQNIADRISSIGFRLHIERRLKQLYHQQPEPRYPRRSRRGEFQRHVRWRL